jgi:hypothetical protein
MKVTIEESMSRVQAVIRESARNSERLVEIKERLVKRNTREEIRFNRIKEGKTLKAA